MNSTPTELIKDPLFQLNAVLWLAQPLADESEIAPLFYKAGFAVYAIAPLLAPPPDSLLTAREASISMRERIRPDVVLAHERNSKFAFTECKANSFGPTSSTADQARTLLVVAGPRAAEVLGLAPAQVKASLSVFLLPEDSCKPLAETLSTLAEELNENGLSTGRFSIFGLSMTASELSIVIDDLGSDFFALPSGRSPFMKLEPDTDPRPLYFIPYDPDVTPSEQEKPLCKRMLFERMQSTIVSAVGRAIPPTKLVFESQKLLNDAMFGMYGQWENPDSARHMRKLCNQFMNSIKEAVNGVAPDAMDFQPEEGWIISFLDEGLHDRIMDALTSFFCERLDLPDQQLTFFDELEDSAP